MLIVKGKMGKKSQVSVVSISIHRTVMALEWGRLKYISWYI